MVLYVFELSVNGRGVWPLLLSVNVWGPAWTGVRFILYSSCCVAPDQCPLTTPACGLSVASSVLQIRLYPLPLLPDTPDAASRAGEKDPISLFKLLPWGLSRQANLRLVQEARASGLPLALLSSAPRALGPRPPLRCGDINRQSVCSCFRVSITKYHKRRH